MHGEHVPMSDTLRQRRANNISFQIAGFQVWGMATPPYHHRGTLQRLCYSVQRLGRVPRDPESSLDTQVQLLCTVQVLSARLMQGA